MSFWDIFWFIVISFAFVAYLMVMFSIITDLFRDKSVSGWAKAAWMICLVFFPFLTAVVYLIARGRSMGDRQVSALDEARSAQDEYIRSVAGSRSPAEQITQAQQLLSAGSISQAEFEALKAKALA